MTTIYKTTFKGGRREICALPCDQKDALATIKRVAEYMGWKHWTINASQIEVRMGRKQEGATYSVVENNC